MFKPHPRTCEKVASDLGFGGVFCQILHQLQLASHDMVGKVSKNKIPNSKLIVEVALTHSWLELNLKIVVCLYDTLENNFGMNYEFEKYFKESW